MIRGEGRMVSGSGGRSTPQALDVQGRRFSGHLSAIGGGITDTFNRPDSTYGDPGLLGYSDSGHQWTNDFGGAPGDGTPESVILDGRLHVKRTPGPNTQTTHLGGGLNIFDTRVQGPGLVPGGVWDATFEWELTSTDAQKIQLYTAPLSGNAGVSYVEFYPSSGFFGDGTGSWGGPDTLRLVMQGGVEYSWTEFPFTFQAGVIYKLRWFFDGTAVRAKIWLASQDQPTAWTFEHTGPAVGYNGTLERAFSISYEFTGGSGEIILENLNIVGVGSDSVGAATWVHMGDEGAAIDPMTGYYCDGYSGGACLSQAFSTDLFGFELGYTPTAGNLLVMVSVVSGGENEPGYVPYPVGWTRVIQRGPVSPHSTVTSIFMRRSDGTESQIIHPSAVDGGTSGGQWLIWIYELANVSDDVDVASNEAASGNPMTSGSVTPSEDAIVIGAFGRDGPPATTFSPGSGWFEDLDAQVPVSPNIDGGVIRADALAGVPTNPTMTAANSTRPWHGVTAAFHKTAPSASAGGPALKGHGRIGVTP